MRAILAIALLSAAAFGQQCKPAGDVDCGKLMGAKPAVKAPLKCGQYQHEQKTPAGCANVCDESETACEAICLSVPATDQCVDDIHFVTEKEWQNILRRLALLESK